MPKKYPNLTFIDCETTGMNPIKDRVVEIAAIRVENGIVVKSFSTLINPDKDVPFYIYNITGINNQMLEGKPTFYDIKDELKSMFEDSIFVSHNSHFDYGFIREEFKRYDEIFRIKHLCTVRLFKHLYPKIRRHNLDSVIEYFNLDCENRHRALDDCKVLVDFYTKINEQFDSDKIQTSISEIINKQSTPPKIIADDVSKLPTVPGVYIFYSKDDIPLYVGKSINIKERVMSHFSNIASITDLKIIKEIYKIKYVECAGEFGALITENRLIKDLCPVYNKKQRRNKKLIAVVLVENKSDYSNLQIEEFSKIDIQNLSNIAGIFKNIKQAKEFIIQKSIENKLCLKVLGLEKGSGACFNYHLQKCDGACIGHENYLKHNIKFIMAFTTNKYKSWPFNGPKVIKEENSNGLKEYHLINNWKYLGKVENENAVSCATDTGLFDLDEYKILSKYLL